MASNQLSTRSHSAGTWIAAIGGIIVLVLLVLIGPLQFLVVLAIEQLGLGSSYSYPIELERQPSSLLIDLPPTDGSIEIFFEDHGGVQSYDGFTSVESDKYVGESGCERNCRVMFELSPSFNFANNQITVSYTAADSEYLDDLELVFRYKQ